MLRLSRSSTRHAGVRIMYHCILPSFNFSLTDFPSPKENPAWCYFAHLRYLQTTEAARNPRVSYRRHHDGLPPPSHTSNKHCSALRKPHFAYLSTSWIRPKYGAESPLPWCIPKKNHKLYVFKRSRRPPLLRVQLDWLLCTDQHQLFFHASCSSSRHERLRALLALSSFPHWHSALASAFLRIRGQELQTLLLWVPLENKGCYSRVCMPLDLAFSSARRKSLFSQQKKGGWKQQLSPRKPMEKQ